MNWTKVTILRQIFDSGGVTNEYPFIEVGLEQMLVDLLREGLVTRVPSEDNFDEIHITDNARAMFADELDSQVETTPWSLKPNTELLGTVT